MSISRRVGLVVGSSKGREGKRKRFLSFGCFGLFLIEVFGFWFLIND
jgi:hypothetical protein